MIAEAVVITIIVCSVSLVGYLARLIFLSKCKKSECCGGVIHVERDTQREEKNVSNLKLPI